MANVDNTVTNWVILPSDRSSFLSAKLMESSRSEIVFSADQRVEPGDTIVACPALPDKEIHHLDYDDVLQHPERIEGRVIRMQMNYIVISPTARADRSSFFSQESEITVKDRGLKVNITASGEPTLQKLTRWVSLIQEKSLASLRLIIDFSLVEKLPQTGCSILQDALLQIKKHHRQIAVIGLETLCPTSVDLSTTLSATGFIRHFAGKEQAEAYFNERPIQALVVEDDTMTAARIAHFLQRFSITPILTETAEDAIDELAMKTPALILMDIHLPGMSGIEASHKIRLQNNMESIPLFMLTADASEDAVKQCMQANVNGYILKMNIAGPRCYGRIQTRSNELLTRYCC